MKRQAFAATFWSASDAVLRYGVQVATTLVLIAVFVPITFLEGNVGRLFSEFAVALAAAVGFSGFVSLTLTPMMASKILKPHTPKDDSSKFEAFFLKVRQRYNRWLEAAL